MGRKLALIIGNSEYDDSTLARLVAPDVDVSALADTLRSPQVGGFDEVLTFVNQPAGTVRRAISGFFVTRGRDDLLLLYFSGHGIRDDRGQLFLAVKDTEPNLLRGTAIPASFITEEMDNSRSRRQVLILDCCHSGAFSHGMKGAPGASVGTAAAFEGTGFGRVVLTATDSTQYAWEGDQVVGQAEHSVFTQHLIHGLRSGQADTDGDGQITLDELYDYVYEQVVTETPKQTPSKWSYGQQGDIIIARNPTPVVKAAVLPPDLQQTIDDPRPWVREGAVRELDRLLHSITPGMVLAAREALERLSNDDSRRVASLAANSLAVDSTAPVNPAGGPPAAAKSPTVTPFIAENPPASSADTEQPAAQSKGLEYLSDITTPAGEADITPSVKPGKPARVKKSRIGQNPVEVKFTADADAAGSGSTSPQVEREPMVAVPMTAGVNSPTTDLNTQGIRMGHFPTFANRKPLRLPPAFTKVGNQVGRNPYLIIASGWIFVALIGINSLDKDIVTQVVTFVLMGAIGGLTVWLAMRNANSSPGWKLALLPTLGWAIGLGFGAAITEGLGETLGNTLAGFPLIDWDTGYLIGRFTGWMIGGAFGGAIGGLSIALAQQRGDQLVQTGKIGKTVLRWTIIWAVSIAIFLAIATKYEWTDLSKLGFILPAFLIIGALITSRLKFLQPDRHP